jgi:hypothetical protein
MVFFDSANREELVPGRIYATLALQLGSTLPETRTHIIIKKALEEDPLILDREGSSHPTLQTVNKLASKVSANAVNVPSTVVVDA